LNTRKIDEASKATHTVQEYVGHALEALEAFNGRIVNGYGVYSDVGGVPAENPEGSEKSGDFARRSVMSPACSHSSRFCSLGSLAGSTVAPN
jgi:hypothetical protein